MTAAHKGTIVGLVIAVLLAAFLTYGWVSAHIDGAVLAVQQKADNEAAVALLEKDKEQQEALATQLATFATAKQVNVTPAQIVKALPQVINLPAPIYQVTAAQVLAAATPSTATLPEMPQAGDLVIPAIAVKPFYDAQVDCKANEAKLASCQLTTNTQTQLLAVKDTEIQQQAVALKGGTFWQRTKAAAKFIAIGAALGAVAVAASK